MPSLSEHQSSKFTKLLLIGDSSTGKTGALASLVLAGFKLRIIDLDNGLDSLVAAVRKVDASKLANVEYVSLRDPIKAGPMGPILNGPPKAFKQAMEMLENWNPPAIGQTGAVLGPARAFGPDTILVIDSFTFLGDAAYNWAKGLNPSAKDGRQIYGAAQEMCESVLAELTSEAFKANVIVISHVRWTERPDGSMKGYPTAIGAALGPKIPAFFNISALVESVGTPPKRSIRTVSTALIDLKSPVLTDPLPIETGLATLFNNLRKT